MSKTHLQKKTQITDDDDLITSIYNFQPTNQDLYLYFAVNKTAGDEVGLDNYRIVISKYYYESPKPDAPSPFFDENWEWTVYTIPDGTSNIANSENKIVAKIWTTYEYRFNYTNQADGSVDLNYLYNHRNHLDDLGFSSLLLRCIARNLFGDQMRVMDQIHTTSVMDSYMLWLQDDLDALDTAGYTSVSNWPVLLEFPPRQFPGWEETIEANTYLNQEDYPEMIHITEGQIVESVTKILNHNSGYFSGTPPDEVEKDLKFDMDAVSFIRTYDKWYSYAIAPFRKTHKITESDETITSYWLHPDIHIELQMKVYDEDEGGYVDVDDDITYSELLTKSFESDNITYEVSFTTQCVLGYLEFITGIDVNELLDVKQYPVLEPGQTPSDEIDEKIFELIDCLLMYQEQLFVWMRNFIIKNGLLTDKVDNLTRNDLIKINSLFYLNEDYEKGVDNLYHNDKPYMGIYVFLLRIEEKLPTILEQTNLEDKYWQEQWLGPRDESEIEPILLNRLHVLWNKIWNEETKECYFELNEEFWNHNSYQQRTALWEDFKDALVGDEITILPEFLMYEQGNNDYIFTDLTVRLDLPELPENGILIEHDEAGDPFITRGDKKYWFGEFALTAVYDLYRVLDNILLKAFYGSSLKFDPTKNYIFWLSTDVEIVVKEILGCNDTTEIELTNQVNYLPYIYPSSYDPLPEYSYLKFFSIIEPWAKTNSIKYERDKEYLWMTRCYDYRFTSLFSGEKIVNETFTYTKGNYDVDQVRHYKTRELLTEFKLYEVNDPLLIPALNATEEQSNDLYTYLIDETHCLPLYTIEKHRINFVEFPNIECGEKITEDERERLCEIWEDWLYTIALQIKKITYKIKKQIADMLLEYTINGKTYYSVDSYLSEDISTLLDNINEEISNLKPEYGVYQFELTVLNYIESQKDYLLILYGGNRLEMSFTGNRFNADQRILGNSYNEKSYNVNLVSESVGILNSEGEYYSGLEGTKSKAKERKQRWETYSGRYDVFYDYAMNVLSPAYDPEDTSTPITVEMIKESELEVYDSGKIYKIFYATQEGSVVTELNTRTGISVEDLLVHAVETILGKSITLLNMCAYVEPIWDSEHEAESMDALIEYSQMLKTIQEDRNVIQLDPTKMILKFTQTEKGTIFEILKSRVLSTTETEEINAFYIGLGYGEPSDEQIIKATPLTDQPYRITVIPQFYTEEPLDWIQDDYYSTFLFDQNSNNLDIQFDNEFNARNGTIITKNYQEQNIIGYYIIKTN